MSEDKASYRQIFKATSLFGGVQIFIIILSVLRSKIIAVLLGPTGMGIVGLLTATTGLVAGITNFGLGTSAVREIAAANETGEKLKISKTITVFRRLVWITGTLGMILTIIFSKFLSEFTFGNSKYTLGFVWLSITLLFNQLTSGQDVLLQGMRKLKSLAKANVFGSLFGLIISFPLYYYYGLEGIVPALIISSFSVLLVTSFFAKSIKINSFNLTYIETIRNGQGMLKLGFFLSLSGLISLGASYLVRIYISNIGGIAEVGLYNAGFAIISTYVGLVFSAMATDYYPRLSGVSNDNKKSAILINQQAEIAILILAPILCIFLIFIDWVVIILYSEQFIAVNGMIHYAALGMIFKAASWSIAFIVLAKGDSKSFFWNELIANCYLLIFNLIGYKLMGLDGLGVSFIFGYFFYFLQIYFFAKIKYEFYVEREFFKIFIIQFLFVLICFVIIKFIENPYNYLIGILVIIVSSMFTLKEMDKRIGFLNAYNNFKNRNNGK
jgi:O-antigen/teichoic acid export membrane protein